MHFIGMSGIHGCLPQFWTWGETRRLVCESLDLVHDLTRQQRRDLIRLGYIELKPNQGSEYASITECNCRNPEVHDDAW